MSGTSNIADTVMVRAIAKRLTDPAAELTAAEQAGLDRFVIGMFPAGGDTGGFPAAPGGDVNGWNSLCRTNWFNGRFLTAEALRRQDAYFDYRARLDAQALMPGVAYGLGLAGDGLNRLTYNSESPTIRGGFPVDADLQLLPGLAFDMIGRPILVPTAFTFQLEQLIALQKAKPRRVVGGGTQFTPCICIAPDPAGPTGGSAALQPGPYLLIIEAAEQASGDAKVYGAVCSDSQPVTCQADTWCGGFGLSLVRFPVEVPESEPAQTVWDLRGILSAYFFDVFEHSLIRRWDPQFAWDERFCRGAASGRRDTAAIALAMVYLGVDGTALWLDPWIPRRSIVDTPAEDWHRTTFGQPPRAAAWARIHQFQCMLSESLAVSAMSYDGQLVTNRNLLRRGFRHIPPIGFLPIDPAIAGQLADPVKPNTGDVNMKMLLTQGATQGGLVAGLASAAQDLARTYFAGTNVIAYPVVALHDDDILEDLANTFDKDPIQVWQQPEWRSLEAGLVYAAREGIAEVRAVLALALQIAIDDLVNRRIELVKLIVPLEGLTRRHPIVGVVAEDAADQLPDWGLAAATSPAAMELASLGSKMRLDMLPREFVVYVKQRLVLEETLFTIVELLGRTFDSANRVLNMEEAKTPSYVGTADMRAAWAAQPQQDRALTQAALAHPGVQFALARALPLVQPDFAVTGRADTFQAQVDAQNKALQASVADAGQRRQLALDQVADSYAAVYPGYQLVQLMVAVQTPDDATSMVQSIGAAAGAMGDAALAPAPNVEDAALAKGPPVFQSADAARLFAQLRDANAAAPATSLVRTAPAGVTVGQLLASTPEQATALLGSARAFATFQRAYGAQLKSGAETVRVVAAPPAEIPTPVRNALAGATADAAKAIETAQAAAPAEAPVSKWLESAKSLAGALGPGRVQSLAPILLRRGG